MELFRLWVEDTVALVEPGVGGEIGVLEAETSTEEVLVRLCGNDGAMK